MINKYPLCVIVFLSTFLSGFGQGSETFTLSNAGTGYANNSYTGDSGVTWSYVASRDEDAYGITGKGLMLRRTSDNSKVTSSSVAGGIGNFTCKLRKGFTGAGNRQVELFVNGISQGTSISWDNNTVQTFSANNINITGNVIVEIRNITANQVVIDDISWTVYTPCTAPPNPVGSIIGTTPSCNSTSLTYTGAAAPPIENYWQNTATGTSTANNAASTYNVTSTGTYYVRAYNSSTACWSTGSISYAVTINTTPNISTQPSNTSSLIPNAANFTVAASGSPVPTYQWQVSINGGGTWSNISTGSGWTTTSYTTPATTEAMNNYQYRCVVTNTCGTVTSNPAVLTLTNNSPNNALNLAACLGQTTIDLSWTASSGTLVPTGYIVFAQPGASIPTMAPAAAGNASGYITNTNYTAATTYGTLGRAVYKGNATSTSITGLTNGSNYTFKVVAYFSEAITGWSNSINTSGSWNSIYTIGVPQVSITGASVAPTSSTITWTNPLPTSCYEILVVANQGTVVFTPSGNGSAYNANSVYSGPNQVVFKGTGTVVSVTNLIQGVNYCYRIFVRKGTEWSSGIQICQTTGVSFCNSSGDGSDGFLTLIRQVQFNTINNSTTSVDNAYSNFTALSTNVILGEFYDLSVNVNTDGAFITYTRAWIDLNNNGSFNDAGEEYDLGSAYNTTNGATSATPLSIEIPTGATIGSTRMRISTRYNSYSTSCQTGFDGEVEDYTINVQRPVGPEINIKGNAISIPSGFNSPYGLNNTLFAATSIGASAGAKTYTIQNIGLSTLNLTGTPRVVLTGDHPGDFTVIQPSATSIASTGSLTFQINFTPTGDGERTAIVSIANNDITGNENPYTFMIKGTGTCPSAISSTILPNSGPVGTEVTITSPNNLTGASATINGLMMTTITSTATELVVRVPLGATSGPLRLILSNGCSSSNNFSIINNAINGCEASSSSTIPGDLFISEVTDATSGSSSYVELYNGTASNINLNNYSIRVYNNGSSSPSSINVLTGTLNAGSTYVVTLGTTSCTPNNLTATIGQSFNTVGGINFDNDSSDMIALYKTSTSSIIDAMGLYQSNNWANGLGVGNDGVNFRRKNTASPLPRATFSLSDWDVIDWTSCSDSNYANFGVYDFSVGVPPTVSLQPIAPVSDCDLTATLTIAGAEGYDGPGDSQDLTYRWFYNAPNTNTWVEILSSDTNYSGQQSTTLNVLNTLNYNNYQYYAQVRENSATCYKATNAVKLKVQKSTWDGTAWLPAPPNINTIAILNGNYDMTTLGANHPSFSACQLIINSGTLTIEDNKFVEIENNITVDGFILLRSKGTLIQNNNAGIINGAVLSNRSKITVEKMTALLNNWYEYTYWSSPVSGESIGAGLAESKPSRRFWFNGANFLDETREIGNNNLAIEGQDDIDDNADDWTFASASMIMTPGVGFAATHNTVGFMGTGNSYKYTFEGPFNNGIVTVPIFRNDSEMMDNNWNFIGNPYPSAISADSFISANSVFDLNGPGGPMTGAIFLWSQNSAPSGTANGNENLNFAQSDYAIINGTGQTAGGDGVTPTRYIPSGQGFFVSMANIATSSVFSGQVKTTNVVFNNSMRVKTNNDQFFRNSDSNNDTANKLWLNLNSNNGVFSQIMIGYVAGATDGDDGMYYDATKNLSSGAFSLLYSLIDDSPALKFGIQGRNPQSLTMSEVIPLGFYTSIDQITTYELSLDMLEGRFMSYNTIYLNDKLLGVVHNLSMSSYNFTSLPGEFNNRFEIGFTDQSLSVMENEIPPNGLSIIELPSGQVKFVVGNNLNILSVEIIDILGRTLYTLKGNSPTEVYELTNLSQSAYMAKVTLSNGQVITKRAVKRK